MKKILDEFKGQYVSALLTLSIPVFIVTNNGKLGFIVACLASLALFIEGTIQTPPNKDINSEIDNWIAGWRPRTPPSEESNSSETKEEAIKE